MSLAMVKSKRGLKYQKKLLYLTVVLWDISDLKFVQNKNYTSRNNSFYFGMKVALSTQDSSKFKFDMSINMSLRFYCASSLILSIPVAEDYHIY